MQKHRGTASKKSKISKNILSILDLLSDILATKQEKREKPSTSIVTYIWPIAGTITGLIAGSAFLFPSLKEARLNSASNKKSETIDEEEKEKEIITIFSPKRCIISTIVGLVLGVIFSLLVYKVQEISWFGTLTIISNFGLTGLCIGISVWEIVWWLHGILLGLVFSTPMLFASLWVTQMNSINLPGKMITILVSGIIMGFLIEFLTSIVFKAPKLKHSD